MVYGASISDDICAGHIRSIDGQKVDNLGHFIGLGEALHWDDGIADDLIEHFGLIRTNAHFDLEIRLHSTGAKNKRLQ